MRVVSLLPSSTEVVCSLGMGRHLVGRSHECDHPGWVRELPACTTSKLDLDGTSYGIDERVRGLVQEGLSVYRVDAERLRSLEPDLILTQDHCEVCAVDLETVEEAAGRVLGRDVEVRSTSPVDLEGVWEGMVGIARSLGVAEKGEELVERLRARMHGVEGRAREVASRPRVALVEWIDPLMAAGNWMPTLVDMAGGKPLFGRAGEHSPGLRWEKLRGADPDAIVVVPCGFDLDRARREMSHMARRDGWDALTAVRRDRVFVVDGHQYFNRPGPRLVESLEILAEILHPEIFDFGHRGGGWIPAPHSA